MLENFIQKCDARTCSVIPVSYATQVLSLFSILVQIFRTNILKQVLHGLLSALFNLDTHGILHRVIVWFWS